MKQFKNTVAFPGSLIVGEARPVDDRIVVQTYDDLIEANGRSTWAESGAYLNYTGMVVSVTSGDKKGTYVYVGESGSSSGVKNSNNWIKQINSKSIVTTVADNITNDQIIGAKAAKEYIDSKISNAGSVFRYRGTVASEANLPQGTYNNEAVLVGDVFTALDSQVNYICYRIQGRKTITVAGKPLEAVTANITKKINFESGLSGSNYGNAASAIQKLASAGTLKVEIGSTTKDLSARLIDMSESQNYSKVAIACYDSSDSSIYVITGVKAGTSDTCTSTKFVSGAAITPATYVTVDSATSQYDYDSFGGVLSLQWN